MKQKSFIYEKRESNKIKAEKKGKFKKGTRGSMKKEILLTNVKKEA
jgi:hypothetical protein